MPVGVNVGGIGVPVGVNVWVAVLVGVTDESTYWITSFGRWLMFVESDVL